MSAYKHECHELSMSTETDTNFDIVRSCYADSKYEKRCKRWQLSYCTVNAHGHSHTSAPVPPSLSSLGAFTAFAITPPHQSVLNLVHRPSLHPSEQKFRTIRGPLCRRLDNQHPQHPLLPTSN